MRHDTKPCLVVGLTVTLLLAVFILASAQEKTQSYAIVEKVSDNSYTATVSKIEVAVKGANLVIIGEPNYQMMQRMVGKQRRGSKAYFIFRPDLGIPIFDNDYNAALEVPLKVLIWEREDGKTVIRYFKPSSAFAHYKGLDSLGKNLDDLIGKITDAGLKK